MLLIISTLLFAAELVSGLQVAVYRQEGRERRAIDGKAYRLKSDPQLTLVVETFNGNPIYLLDVEETSKEFVSSRFAMRRFDVNNREILTREYPACHYRGRVRGVVGSRVLLSTCRGINGIIHDGKKSFTIRPDDDETKGSHVLMEDEKSEPTSYCGVSHSPRAASHTSRPTRAVHNHLRKRFALYPYTVELTFVADKSLYNKLNGNRTELQIMMMRFANIMSDIYKRSDRGVRIALVGIEIWSNSDQIEVLSDFKKTLDNFVMYNGETLQKDANFKSDNAQLLTGIDFDGSTKGYAGLDTICQGRSSAAVIEIFSTSGGNVAGIMAHEMGHNFGMRHDDDISGCVCSDSDGCVMSAVLSGKYRNYTFSECSRQTLRDTLNGGQGACLANDPDQLFGSPVCGNGFVESGETCDCGTAQECVKAGDQCCNPRTCKLVAGAVCSDADDGCCKNCQFASAGTLCRKADGVCDLVEVCTGQSADCPDNIYKLDGTTCAAAFDEDGICYRGACRGRTEQCRRFWGSDAANAFEACYQTNSAGKFYGHCGKNAQDEYVACDDKDVNCGKLQCFSSEDRPVTSLAWRSATFKVGAKVCKSVSILTDNDERDLGLVEDGTKCGDGKICLSNECVNVSVLPPPTSSCLKDGSCDDPSAQTCPKDSAGLVCSGNGFCTNIGTCFCSEGYDSADCSSQSGGGSNVGVVAGVVVTLVLLLILLFLFAFCYPNVFFRPCPALRPKGKSSSMKMTGNGESSKPVTSIIIERPRGPPRPSAAPKPASKPKLPPQRPPVPKKPVV